MVTIVQLVAIGKVLHNINAFRTVRDVWFDSAVAFFSCLLPFLVYISSFVIFPFIVFLSVSFSLLFFFGVVHSNKTHHPKSTAQ